MMEGHPYILTIDQIRACEKFTMEQYSISSLELMEQAGDACAHELISIAQHLHATSFSIFCGTGNNSGDGLVIARLLALAGYPIQVILCKAENAHFSREMQTNLERWIEIAQHQPSASTINFEEQSLPDIPKGSIIVDAIFGIGINKPVTGIYGAAIAHINHSEMSVVSIDIPSGMMADEQTPKENIVVRADYTLTMQFQKIALLLPETYGFCGEVRVMDIGIIPAPDMDVKQELILPKTISTLIEPRFPYANKGTFGHGLLIAGSADMPGAAILAGTSALRGGLGKLTIHTSKAAAAYLPVTLPEAILHPDTNEQYVTELNWDTLQPNINALAIGPGIGTQKATVNLLKDILETVHSPLILDADALNILARDKTWLAYLPPYSILTPHVKEFERLTGKCDNDFERLSKARTFAERYSIVLILKGFHTIISTPNGDQFFNTTGNPGMATAGSGDVLTGLLLALLAQGYTPITTALLGVYIHGLAGDMAIENSDSSLSMQSLIASDLPKFFGIAFKQIYHSKN